MSILQASAILQIKYTTARHIISYWKVDGELYRNAVDKAKVAEILRKKQRTTKEVVEKIRQVRKCLMISVEVPERAKLMVRLEDPITADF